MMLLAQISSSDSFSIQFLDCDKSVSRWEVCCLRLRILVMFACAHC